MNAYLRFVDVRHCMVRDVIKHNTFYYNYNCCQMYLLGNNILIQKNRNDDYLKNDYLNDESDKLKGIMYQ